MSHALGEPKGPGRAIVSWRPSGGFAPCARNGGTSVHAWAISLHPLSVGRDSSQPSLQASALRDEEQACVIAPTRPLSSGSAHGVGVPERQPTHSDPRVGTPRQTHGAVCPRSQVLGPLWVPAELPAAAGLATLSAHPLSPGPTMPGAAGTQGSTVPPVGHFPSPRFSLRSLPKLLRRLSLSRSKTHTRPHRHARAALCPWPQLTNQKLDLESHAAPNYQSGRPLAAWPGGGQRGWASHSWRKNMTVTSG